MDLTEPAVRTSGGQVRGRKEDDVVIFRGIPFARLPVGGLRFAAPRPAEPRDGVRDAAGRASLHTWDQHRFGVLDLTPALA